MEIEFFFMYQIIYSASFVLGKCEGKQGDLSFNNSRQSYVSTVGNRALKKRIP
jgi:hypothetical protein